MSIETEGLGLAATSLELARATLELKDQRDQLLAWLKWSVSHADECLGDHPLQIDAARRLIAAAESQ